MSGLTETILSLITLIILEVVLGIDNLVFLAIISQKLPRELQPLARRIGLSLAWIMRLLLLACSIWLTKLVQPLFHLGDFAVSGRDLFLFFGGIFLLGKATQQIHLELDLLPAATDLPTTPSSTTLKYAGAQFRWVILQIALLDLVFSIDSILTAIGLTQQFWLMTVAITVAIAVMLLASEPLSAFLEKHPSVKMLALSYLILIGMVLIADSFHFHIPRGYLYFAMGFSLGVEILNLLYRRAVGKRKH